MKKIFVLLSLLAVSTFAQTGSRFCDYDSTNTLSDKDVFLMSLYDYGTNQMCAGTRWINFGDFRNAMGGDYMLRSVYDVGDNGIVDNAEAVVNGVYTTGNQTIGGIKTFSSTIVGNISGNAGTVTNGVYTTGNQTIGGTKTITGTFSFDDGLGILQIPHWNGITPSGEAGEIWINPFTGKVYYNWKLAPFGSDSIGVIATTNQKNTFLKNQTFNGDVQINNNLNIDGNLYIEDNIISTNNIQITNGGTLIDIKKSPNYINLLGGDVGIGINTPQERLHITWALGVDAGFFRGTTDTDITGTFSRSPNGTKWYQWINDAGVVQTSTTHP